MVFFMAFNRCNKLAKLPTCVLTCPFKISKKHSHLILMPFILTAKKTRPKAVPQPPIRVSLPLRPKILPFMLLLLVFTQPLININIKDNNKGEEEVEDNNIKKLPPPLVVRFISI